MKGIVFNILESLIVEKFGDDIMEGIYDKTDFVSDVPPFIGPETYPDADLIHAVTLLSEMTDISVSDLLFEFGKYMFPILAETFPVFLEGFDSPLEFLKTVDGVIHIEVRKLYGDANPPVLRVESVDENTAVLHYRSERKLCRLMEGLLEGLAAFFGRSITYHHLECMLDGADECILNIQFK